MGKLTFFGDDAAFYRITSISCYYSGGSCLCELSYLDFCTLQTADDAVCRKFSDDAESDSEDEEETAKPAGYYEEQEAIRQR